MTGFFSKSLCVCVCVCVCVVQHGMVYQECDANGQWVTTKNTSECDSNDLSQVRNVSFYKALVVVKRNKPQDINILSALAHSKSTH